MHFDAGLRELWSETSDVWQFEMPAGWLQGRSVFGGLSAAALAALGRRVVSPDRKLRTANTQLLRPTAPGRVTGSVRVVREGKSTSFVQAALAQDGQETALANLVFVRPREGSAPVTGLAPFTGPQPETLPDMPYLAGITPEFTQHIALRWATGSPPFTGADQARLDGYCRFRVPAGGAEGVLGLLDMWPSPSLSVLNSPALASTVSWTAHILLVPKDFEQWFRFSYETVAGKDGMHTCVGHLHNAEGALVGFTEQLVAIFD